MKKVKPFGKYDTLGAYHWSWYRDNTFGYRDQVNEVVKYFTDEGSILDVGCGDGLTSFKLYEKGLNVTGIELDEKAVGFARSKCGAFVPKDKLSFSCMSVYDLNETGKYDFALVHDVIEHLEKPRLAIDKIVRSIKNYCIITTPNADHCSLGQYDYQFWNAESIKKLLKGYTYDLLKSGEILHIKLYKTKGTNGKRKLAYDNNERKKSPTKDTRKRVLVTVPNTGNIHKNVVFSLLKLQRDSRYNLTIMLPTHNPYENNLHHIVKDFVDQKFDFWLSIDSDNPPLRNPLDLIELDKDIIGCPTPIWHFKGDKKGERPIYWNGYDYVPEEDAYKEHEPRDGLQEVSAVGTGCFVIKNTVFMNEKMRLAPFERKLYKDGRVHKGNDMSFCELLRENGFKIFAHYGYPCQHFCNLELNEVVQAFRDLNTK
jgi:2-polyprenyl-3-methyl-5-hydroxy-6-metoxy-1,4-benzoquinol methylase